MSFITLDFETFYGKQFSLSKMTTEEYIRDPQFEVIGVGVKVDGYPTRWYPGDRACLKDSLSQYDWKNSALICHNAMFDGAILKWIFGEEPEFYIDTLCMARAIHGVEVGGSLAALVEQYGLGMKGTEVVYALDKMRMDFNAEDLSRYGNYCMNDVELTRKLFDTLAPGFSGDELRLIDMTLRMYINPVLEIDDALLVSRLEEVKREKSELLAGLMAEMKCETEEDVRKKLASNPQFAALLVERGVEPPMKESPANKKQTFALAKNDEGFIALTEHDDPVVQQLCAVRLGTKSTIEESRIERFIKVGARNKGKLPVPLKYYGAHTGRWSGLDSINLQNLPSRDKKKKALKNALRAPDGHYVINCDSSQIEARVLAWLAGQTDVVKAFADKRDVYCEFATKVYKKPITKENPVERFVGKTCILGLGYGTGAEKLRHTLKTQPPGADLPIDDCQNMVNIYRTSNSDITQLWRDCDNALGDLAAWPDNKPSYYLGNHKAVLVTPTGLKLPNGLYIRYNKLSKKDDGKWVYASRRGEVNIWGGAMVENLVQALARIIVGQQMLDVNERYRTILTVHDAGVWVIPEDVIEEALAFITACMSKSPDWAAGCPVTCEAKYGRSYGEC